MTKLYLASSSPRRIEILKKLGVNFEVLKPRWETRVVSDYPGEVVELTALEKARSVVGWVDEGFIVAADTIVVTLKKEILGKPKNVEEAREHLKKLSGKWHTVYTGIAIIKQPERKEYTDHSYTKVKFKELDPEEIECYLRSEEYVDKAGSYAIQGIASLLIEEINGDYYTVVGLPLNKLYKILKYHGYDLLKESLRRCK